MAQTFRKNERLCSRKEIQELFEKGNSFFIHPFKVIWKKKENENSLVQILISVPKKNIKSAVDRNKIKRRIREAYRKNKSKLADNKELNCSLILIFTSKEEITYKETESKIILLLNRLKHEYEKTDI